MLQSYENIHGYLAVTICVLGTIFNIVNILVLSHKVTTVFFFSKPSLESGAKSVFIQIELGKNIPTLTCLNTIHQLVSDIFRTCEKTLSTCS